MSREVAVDGRESSQRARAYTSTASPFSRPSERGLVRSKSAGALNIKSAPSANKYWIPVPAAGREGDPRPTTSRSIVGNKSSDPSPPSSAQDTRHTQGLLEPSRTERAKTPVKSAAAAGLGNRHRTLGSGGSGDLHMSMSTLTSITARVRPKLASFTTNLRRSKSHNIASSKSASTAHSMSTLAQMAEVPVPVPVPAPVPPPRPAPFARLTPREPVIRRSLSLRDIKDEAKSSRPALSKSNTLSVLPPRKSSLRQAPYVPSNHEITRSRRGIAYPPAEEDENLGSQLRPATSPIRTVNRLATVYAPAPSIALTSSSSSRPTKHLVKPSLSLTLPNGVSIVHEPLLLSPIAPPIRSATSPLTPPPSRPPPRAHLPESPNDFAFGFDIKPEAWNSPLYSPPPSATIVTSYYINSMEANADFRDVITRYIERGDVEGVRGQDSLNIRKNGAWVAPSPQRKAPQAGPGGSQKSSAKLPVLDRQSDLPTPDPITGDGKFPPLPPPPKLQKMLPAIPTTRDEADEDADGSTQVVRSRRSPSTRSHLTPVTPDTPALLTPEGNMAFPTWAPWRAEELSYLSNQEVSIRAKQPSLRIRSKRTMYNPTIGLLSTVH